MQAKFEFHHGDYEKQFLHVLSRKDKTGIVVNNPNQSVFLFIDRQHLQVRLFHPSFYQMHSNHKVLCLRNIRDFSSKHSSRKIVCIHACISAVPKELCSIIGFIWAKTSCGPQICSPKKNPCIKSQVLQ